MKIGHLDKQHPVAQAASERKAAAASGDKPQTEASAKVDLSAAATALSNDAAVDGSFDQAKVEKIAQAIRDGKFEVNAEAIADKLIANAQELLGKRGS